MEEYKYVTGDQALIINKVSNHPFEINTLVIILGNEVNSQLKVTSGDEEAIVSSMDLFPINY